MDDTIDVLRELGINVKDFKGMDVPTYMVGVGLHLALEKEVLGKNEETAQFFKEMKNNLVTRLDNAINYIQGTGSEDEESEGFKGGDSEDLALD